jgi:hypothetical protein
MEKVFTHEDLSNLLLFMDRVSIKGINEVHAFNVILAKIQLMQGEGEICNE